MIDKIAESEIIKNGLDEDQVKNLAKFVHSIQAELAMKAWEKITKINPEVVKGMWEVEVDSDKTFGHYIREVVGVGEEKEK